MYKCGWCDRTFEKPVKHIDRYDRESYVCPFCADDSYTEITDIEDIDFFDF